MPGEWQQQVIRRLLAAAHENGGWGYALGAPGSAEPTALAVLALRDVNEAVEARGAGLRYLSELQRPDGGVTVCAGVSEPAWPTALAMLAWARCGDDSTKAAAKHATQWLLEARGDGAIPPGDQSGYAPDGCCSREDETQISGWDSARSAQEVERSGPIEQV